MSTQDLASDPEYRSKVERHFKKAAFMNDLGVELETIEPGTCVTRLRVMPRHLQQHGFIHAAVQAAMADHTAGGAAQSLVEAGLTVLTIEYKINLLRPARGQLVRCTSRVIKPGRTISVTESDVITIGTNSVEKLTARATVTLAVVPMGDGEEDGVEISPTKEGYDRWAQIYDGEDNPLVQLEEPEIDALLGDVRGLEIADIGCGTGRHALRLASKGARVVGVDFSEGMMNRAREKAAQTGAAVEFLAHDLKEPLPFSNGRFDRVVCALVLDHIERPAALLTELERITKADGKIVASIMHPAMLLRGVEARFRDPDTGREIRPKSYPNQLSDYVNAIARAGLRIDHFEEHTVTEKLAAQSPRAAKYLGWPMLVVIGLSPDAD
jgi:malonyl-CoA O-methyltransferase